MRSINVDTIAWKDFLDHCRQFLDQNFLYLLHFFQNEVGVLLEEKNLVVEDVLDLVEVVASMKWNILWLCRYDPLGMKSRCANGRLRYHLDSMACLNHNVAWSHRGLFKRSLIPLFHLKYVWGLIFKVWDCVICCSWTCWVLFWVLENLLAQTFQWLQWQGITCQTAWISRNQFVLKRTLTLSYFSLDLINFFLSWLLWATNILVLSYEINGHHWFVNDFQTELGFVLAHLLVVVDDLELLIVTLLQVDDGFFSLSMDLNLLVTLWWLSLRIRTFVCHLGLKGLKLCVEFLVFLIFLL